MTSLYCKSLLYAFECADFWVLGQCNSLIDSLLDLSLEPQLPWAKDWQTSNQIALTPSPDALNTMDTLRKLCDHHRLICQGTTLAPEGTAPVNSLYWTFFFFLPQQALMNYRRPCSHFYPGQRGSTSPGCPAEDLWLLQAPSFICIRDSCDWCKHPVHAPFLSIRQAAELIWQEARRHPPVLPPGVAGTCPVKASFE
jgi:hypothetical protein